MTYEQFHDRIMAVNEAKEIFMAKCKCEKCGYEQKITNSITKAWKAYLKVLSDKDRKEYLNTTIHGCVGWSPLDSQFERPNCPECGLPLRMRVIETPKGPGNVYGWRSALYCATCMWEQFSLNTIEDWLRIYKKKDIEQILREKHLSEEDRIIFEQTNGG